MQKISPEDLRLVRDNLTDVLNNHYKSIEAMAISIKVVHAVKKNIETGHKVDEAFEMASKSLKLQGIEMTPDAVRARYYRMLKKYSQ